MNIVQKTIWQLDQFQRQHKPISFVFAVVKKYGDDQAGYQAALITYYGFLSLFPLLLLLTTAASIAGSHDPELGHRLVNSVTSYFPTYGKTLESSIQASKSHGLALVIGLLFTLYGARGVADVFRNAVNHIWHIPVGRRAGFPRAQIRSLSLILGAGAGFIAASIIAGAASAVGHGFIFRAVSIVINLAILYLIFLFILRLSLPLGVRYRQFQVGAAVSAVGVTILQQLGTVVLSHGSKHLSASGALFATTLGLLAWIYLQAQTVMYAVVVDTVRNHKLWPRSLSGQELTPADKEIDKRRSKLAI